jgi:hypothetical protein
MQIRRQEFVDGRQSGRRIQLPHPSNATPAPLVRPSEERANSRFGRADRYLLPPENSNVNCTQHGAKS